MKSILYLTSWFGIYNALMYLWQCAEKAELGYTITTRVDTLICMVISFVLVIALWLGAELEE